MQKCLNMCKLRKPKKQEPYHCHLECEAERLEKLGEPLPKTYKELYGNVRIEVVRPHICKTFCVNILSGCLTMADALVAIAVFAVLIFSATTKDLTSNWNKLHIPLCSLGLILFSGPGIMSINTRYGPSAQLKWKNRWVQHILLTVIGLLMAVAGGVLAFVFNFNLSFTKHCIFGILSYGFGLIAIISGIVAGVKTKRKKRLLNRMVHLLLGLFAFLCYVGCFVTGLLKPAFVKWSIYNINRYHYILLVVVGVYTLIVVCIPCCKCMKYNKKYKFSPVSCIPTKEQIEKYHFEEELNKLYPTTKGKKKSKSKKKSVKQKKGSSKSKKEELSEQGSVESEIKVVELESTTN